TSHGAPSLFYGCFLYSPIYFRGLFLSLRLFVVYVVFFLIQYGHFVKCSKCSCYFSCRILYELF
uniref:EH domain-containing protein n=1 Tax=Parascaris univalens TaxID=6257 RepID=A0A915CBF6_PARUN